MKWLARWCPALLWAVVISLFSTGAFTSDNTSRIIVPLLHQIFPNATLDTLFLVNHYIRKTGHVVEYFILSWLILRGIKGERTGTRLTWALATIGIVAAYASLDEFHQSFVPGRTPAVADVILDTTGAAAAQLVAASALLRRRQESSSQTESTDRS